MSQERTTLINRIMQGAPILSREALSAMTMEQLQNIHRGYRLRDLAEPVQWRESQTVRTWVSFQCPECSKPWSMQIYRAVATTVWCPHCCAECEVGNLMEPGQSMDDGNRGA